MFAWGLFPWGQSTWGGWTLLITDRTAEDVARVEHLNAKKWGSMTAAEQAEWLAGLKGAYNATDLNRVGTVVQYLADLLNGYGYAVTVAPKTDWTISDIPRVSDMQAYLGDVQAIKDKFYGTTPLPEGMDDLWYWQANDIEKLLLEIETYINRMVSGFRKCGTFKSGQGVILP